MNKEQMRYAVAKAALETAKEVRVEYEAAWIKAKGITNEDGTTPERLWAIDCTEEQFDVFCELLDADKEHSKLYAQEIAARKALISAEEALIDYALSIVPASVRATLDAHRKEYRTREKLLDAAFRLDTKTVPSSGRR